MSKGSKRRTEKFSQVQKNWKSIKWKRKPYENTKDTKKETK